MLETLAERTELEKSGFKCRTSTKGGVPLLIEEILSIITNTGGRISHDQYKGKFRKKEHRP